MTTSNMFHRAAAPGDALVHLTGDLIRPDDAGYDAARRLHNLAIDRRPALIVRCHTAQDVVNAVRYARANALPLAVRSGGHAGAGFAVVDGGLVIDLSLMKGMTIDPARRIATAEPGLTWGEYNTHAHAHGLATPAGDTATVAVGGLTLSGGIGWLTRKHGLTIDHLLAAELVTASGEVIAVSEQEHPDLFWALRGGGGNFGIVTRFTFQLQPVRDVVAGFLLLPAEPAIIAAYVRAALQAPDELTTIAALMPVPPAPVFPAALHGRLMLNIGVCFLGDAAEAEAALAPLRSLGPVLHESVAPMPYPEIFRFSEAAATPAPSSNRTRLLNAVDGATAVTMIEQLQRATGAMAVIQIRPLGGALARVPSGATAFAHRTAPVLVSLVRLWDDAASAEQAARARAWTEDLWRTLAPQSVGSAPGFLVDESPDSTHDAYPPATYQRLAAIKRRYDPDNFFRRNWNIAPAQ